ITRPSRRRSLPRISRLRSSRSGSSPKISPCGQSPRCSSKLMPNLHLHLVQLEIPENGNLILGQSHFIKTVEDIYEAIVNTVPQIKFGVAFNEASGPCLTRA